MLTDHTPMNFNPMSGFKYPLQVTLPSGEVKHGFAICAPDIVCNGSHNLEPGFASLEIDELSMVNEIGDVLSHDDLEEMILYGMNDGGCMMAEDDNGLKWEVSFKALPIHG